MPGVGESMIRHNWYKNEVPDVMVRGDNYRAGQATANKKRILFQIVHTQLDKVIAGNRKLCGSLIKN